MPRNYAAADITVLTGLQPVRKRPGMYTNTECPNHLALEVVDNSIDEALAGHAHRIAVTLHSDGSMRVIDNGRGMPIDDHPQLKRPGAEVILTTLHAGAKFSNTHYRFAGGLHGVGVSVVNALSEKLQVTIKRNGSIYSLSFVQGALVTPMHIVGKCTLQERGTEIHFYPDQQYFDSVKFNGEQLQKSLRCKAILLPGLQVNYTDEQNGTYEEWCYDGGMSTYLQELTAERSLLADAIFQDDVEEDDQRVQWCIQWDTDGWGDNIRESYANLIPSGGSHVNGLRSGMIEALREFCQFHKLLPRGIKLVPDDLWNCCHYILSVYLTNAQFSGQTKERLTSKECTAFVSQIIKSRFSQWLNRHIHYGEQITAIAITQAQKRQKRATSRRMRGTPTALPVKLADCTTRDRSRAEIFIVEGDSAGGSAKQARIREYQAILPLRGKLLNTWEVDAEKALTNKEIQHISAAIGLPLGTDNLNGLRYGKVCILADADSDGAHIATLICALFWRHFRPIIDAGHFYIAQPPLYRIASGNRVVYAHSDRERLSILRQEKKSASIQTQRFKGLGEMNPLQLRDTTLSPDKRQLMQLQIASENDIREMMDILFSKKRANDRRQWLMKHSVSGH